MEDNTDYKQLALSIGEIESDKDYDFIGPDPYVYFMALMSMGTANVQHQPVLYNTYVVPNGMLMLVNERTKEMRVMVWSAVQNQYFEVWIDKHSYHTYVQPTEDHKIDMGHLANAVLAAGEPFAPDFLD